MPVIHIKQIDQSTTLYIWHITESVTELLRGLTAEDITDLKDITSDARKLEKCAWRRIVRDNICQSAITYNTIGAPQLETGGYISVSHSGKFAVVVHSYNRVCGVDIERTDRNVRQVVSRYISTAEHNLLGADHPLFNIAVWCAKEAMYKYSQTTELDFLKDLQITDASIDTEALKGCIIDREVKIRLLTINDHIIAYIA